MRSALSRPSLSAIGCAAAAVAVAADKPPFADVGKQEPITILTPSTPWLPAFTKMVELYEQQTGNKIKLDVNPFGGVLDKARNDLRGGGGTYDAVLLDTQWTIEMYEGGFLTPFKDIDPAFDTAEGTPDLRRLRLLERAEALAHVEGRQAHGVHRARQRARLVLPRRRAEGGGRRSRRRPSRTSSTRAPS